MMSSVCMYGFVQWNEVALCKLHRNFGKLKLFIHIGLSNFVHLFCLKLKHLPAFWSMTKSFQQLNMDFQSYIDLLDIWRWLVILELVLKNYRLKISFFPIE